VKSVRSQVTNIIGHLPSPISLETFRDTIVNHVVSSFTNVNSYQFSTTDTEYIQQLVTEKYTTWNWNYGYSPKFTVRKSGKVNEYPVRIEMEIEKGLIQKAAIDYNDTKETGFENALIHQFFREEELKEITIQFFGEQNAESLLKIIF